MPEPSLDQLLRNLRNEPNQPGVLGNTIDSLVARSDVPQDVKDRLSRIKQEVLNDPVEREDATNLRAAQRVLTSAIHRVLDTGAPLQRTNAVGGPLGENTARRLDLGGRRKTRRGGFVNVFKVWREAYLPVRTDPVEGPQVENTILIGLQTMYNDAATAIETGDHVSPPQQVVFDNYDEFIAPVSGDPNRTPGAILRMLAALNSRLPGGVGGRRRSQTKTFGSCVKAVRKTVKARKGSTAESAAIAICTKTLLHPRGRTIKRYRKGRLLTQKRRV